MAWPDPGTIATWDKTANSMGRSIDPVLWPMLCTQSRLIDLIPKFSVDNDLFEWESAGTNSRIYTEASSGSTTIDGSGSNTALVVTDATGLQEGDVIRNATRATPIGTYGADELMEITAVSTNTLTVVRDSGRYNSGTGSTIHALADTFEVVYPAKEEGSSPDANRYKDVTLYKNYTQILDMHLKLTGSQLASKRLLPADNLQRQFDDRLVELMNFVESMFLYGVVQYGGSGTDADAMVGSDSYVRRTKGFQQFQYTAAAATAGTLDYATKDVTETAINDVMEKIMNTGTSPNDRYIIVAANPNIRKIKAFGADKVRITQAESVWGRSIQQYESDLGITMELVPCYNMSKSDLFIVNMSKVGYATFRPMEKEEWGKGTSSPNGVDAWNQRYLGEVGVKVVDAGKSHGAISYIGW